MKKLTGIAFIFFMAVFSSCNISRNVNNTASASFTHLRIAQGGDIKKQNETAYATIVHKETEKIDSPSQDAVLQPIAISYHKLSVKPLAVKASPKASQFVSASKETHTTKSKVKNAELTMKTALIRFAIGLTMTVIGEVLISAGSSIIPAASVNPALIIGGIFAGIGGIMFYVGLISIILVLVRRTRDY